jgi:hypothetical protein
LQAELKIDLTDRLLVPTVSSVGAFFVWPVNVSERNGEKTRWAVTAQEAVDTATSEWTRVIANADEGGYTTFVAQGDLGEPTFPDFDLETVIDLAFKDRIIDTLREGLRVALGPADCSRSSIVGALPAGHPQGSGTDAGATRRKYRFQLCGSKMF